MSNFATSLPQQDTKFEYWIRDKLAIKGLSKNNRAQNYTGQSVGRSTALSTVSKRFPISPK